MPPEADLDTDDPGTAEPGKEVEGLKAALKATRQRAQVSEGRQRDLETTVATLQGRLDGLTAGGGAAPTAPKTYTRADLNQMVEDEKISQDQADQAWENQIVEKAKREATQAARKTIDTGTLESRVNTEIGRYQGALKDLADRESANFQKVKAEFDYLTSIGEDDKDVRTELKALRAAFGSIDALESGTKPREREPFKETGGRGGGEGGDDAAGWPKDMPAAKRTYYQDLINKGAYTKESAIAEFRYKPKYGPRRGKAA